MLMKKTGVLILLLAAFACLGSSETLQGFVSDSNCGVKHNSATEANSKCVAGCLKHGSDPVLVHDGKVLAFDAESKGKAKALGGLAVKIDGVVDNGVLKVVTIDKAE
jgi:hypothetical protein